MAHTTPAIPGRETQLAELAAVVGLHTEEVYHEAPREPAPPLVVVYGGVSTGKSRCVRHVLCAAADHFALIDGTGVMSTREFYREVLGQLHSNSRRRRPRRDGSTTDGAVELDDQDDDVTITDAPMLPVEAEPETKKSVRHAHSRERRGGRKRRVDAERKGSEVEDASGSDSDEEDDASDESTDDGEDTQSRRTKPRTTRAKGNARNGAIGNMDDPIEGEDPAHGSLNFLSFVKAIRGYMNTALPEGGAAIGPKPTVVIALDHVERLLERGFGKLLTCLLTVNDQLDYLHIFDANGAPWRLCVVLVARAVSLNLDLFLHGAHPAFIHFPPYIKEEVAMIVTHNLLGAANSSIALDDSRERAAWLRKWLVSLYDLLPHCHHDWLEFQHVVVQMLPSFYEFFDLVSIDDHAPLPQFDDLPDKDREATADGTNRSWVQLQKASRDRIASLEKSRRRHLFGYDNVARGTATATSFSVASTTAETVSVSSGDPVAFIASSKLSRSCLLLLLASYLASFTPHEADAHFVSSSGGLKRKRRVHRGANALGGANGTSSDAHGGGGARKKSSAATARKAMNQQLIGPKIFELPRLLAIYQSLQIESDALMDELAASDDSGESTRMESARSTRTRADIFSHLSLLVRLRLLQRASPSSDLDQPLFRCIADTRLVHEIARRLQFPLDAYLNTRG